jgi:hypothetical protein
MKMFFKNIFNDISSGDCEGEKIGIKNVKKIEISEITTIIAK